MQPRHSLKERRLRCECVLRQPMILRQQRAQFAQPGRHDFEDRLIRIRRHLLLEMRDAQSVAAPDLAVIRQRSPGDEPK